MLLPTTYGHDVPSLDDGTATTPIHIPRKTLPWSKVPLAPIIAPIRMTGTHQSCPKKKG